MAASPKQVLKLIESWRPRRCKTEKDFERSLFKHLGKNLSKSEVVKQYGAGRVRGDIVVDGRILIEIKNNLDSTSKLQRLFGQLEIYASDWKRDVVLVLCGEHDGHLLSQLKKHKAFSRTLYDEITDAPGTWLVVK